jgi:hypothetical protein
MLGSLFWLLAPFTLFLAARRRLWIVMAAAFTGTFVWGFTFFLDRYLQALVPLYAAVTGAIVVAAWQLGWASRIALIPLVALQIAWSGDALFYSGAGRLASAMRLISSGFERQFRDRFAYRHQQIAASAAIPPGSKLIVHGERHTLGIDHDLSYDLITTQGMIWYDPIRGSRGLYEYYKSLGVTHFLWFSPAIPEYTKQGMVLVSAFIGKYGTDHKTFGSMHLVTLPKAPPPRDENPMVLLLGTDFVDGLYPLDRLAAQEAVAALLKTSLPAPAVALQGDVAALVARAGAIVARQGVTSLPSSAVREFVRPMRYSGYDVYVRRD